MFGEVYDMSLLDLWLSGATLGAQPFSYFGVTLSLSAFIFTVYVIIAVKQVIDNKKQRLLW